jgi:hypothetical protein
VSEHDGLHRAGLSASDLPVPFTDQLRLAVAAYLARWALLRVRSGQGLPPLVPGLTHARP